MARSERTHRETHRVRRLFAPLPALLLLFAMATYGSHALSFTADEPLHLIAGYAFLQEGKSSIWMMDIHGHPPLVNAWSALPVYIAEPNIPLASLYGWGWDVHVLEQAALQHFVPPERYEAAARIPIVLLTIVLAAAVYRWALDWWGMAGALTTVGVLIFDPTLLAHGRLTTTDVGLVSLGTVATICTIRWWRCQRWRYAVVLGVLLSAVSLAKASGVLWVAALALSSAAVGLWRRKPLRFWGQGLAIGVVGLVGIWAFYGFSIGSVGAFPVPVPAASHWRAVLMQTDSVDHRLVFAFGQRKTGRWWWYFPAAFAIKNPIPLIVALMASLARLWRMRLPAERLIAIGVWPSLYTVLAIGIGMNIGYRHMLPVHPWIALTIGGGAAWWHQSCGRHREVGKLFMQRAAMLGMSIWYVVGTLRVWPYEVAFFNELVGGPDQGHRYLVASNLDWGQGYKALRSYIDRTADDRRPMLSANYRTLPPTLYGVDADRLPPGEATQNLAAPLHPAPGLYALSIMSVQLGWPADQDLYAWFRELEPTARLGYSFFVYDVREPPVGWVAQCTVPTGPLTAHQIAEGFGSNEVRVIPFDCSQSWIYPAVGGYAGAYALHADHVQQREGVLWRQPRRPVPTDPFLQRRLSDARLSADLGRGTSTRPGLVLYEHVRSPTMPESTSVILQAAEQTAEAAKVNARLPVSFDGGLDLEGVIAYPDQSVYVVETWWRVASSSAFPARPFSIMGHLLLEPGQVMVGDGMGVANQDLLPGDRIVQVHRFSAVDGQVVWFRAGVYWLDTLDRWSCSSMPDADAVFVRLGPSE